MYEFLQVNQETKEHNQCSATKKYTQRNKF